MISAAQIKLVQIARRSLGIDEPDYRTVLRSLANVESTTKLTHRGMEAVMAYFESVGWVDRNHGRGYWTRQRDTENAREVRLIRSLAAESAYKLPALCLRHSHHRTDDVTQLDWRERYELIEMLKASNRRAAQQSTADPPDESAERADPIPF
jgi:hypothetical protein